MTNTDRRITAAVDREREPITQTVVAYYEGWFDGDVDRIDRALHPELVKRSPGGDGGTLGATTKQRMLDLAARGEGTKEAADRRIEIEIEDVSEGIASVTVRSAPYHEYLHLVRTNDGWKIANVLWRQR